MTRVAGTGGVGFSTPNSGSQHMVPTGRGKDIALSATARRRQRMAYAVIEQHRVWPRCWPRATHRRCNPSTLNDLRSRPRPFVKLGSTVRIRPGAPLLPRRVLAAARPSRRESRTFEVSGPAVGEPSGSEAFRPVPAGSRHTERHSPPAASTAPCRSRSRMSEYARMVSSTDECRARACAVRGCTPAAASVEMKVVRRAWKSSTNSATSSGVRRGPSASRAQCASQSCADHVVESAR